MRKIGLIVAVFLLAACVSEVKPLLKPAKVGIPNRIADQQKWLRQDIASKAVTPEDAKPILDKLDQIQQEYNRLHSAGPLTARESKAINRMLDQTSGQIFRLKQRRRSPMKY